MDFTDEDLYQDENEEEYDRCFNPVNNRLKMAGKPMARKARMKVFLRDVMHLYGPRKGKYWAKWWRLNYIDVSSKFYKKAMKRRKWNAIKSYTIKVPIDN